ncbi:hypothetical protein TNCV_141191 [Trichonephila clavipes]|nr:hypothetical protein TNCV_141191 [Trichonephila clavipes]
MTWVKNKTNKMLKSSVVVSLRTGSVHLKRASSVARHDRLGSKVLQEAKSQVRDLELYADVLEGNCTAIYI